MSGESFRKNYDILQRHAQTLREQDEPNIDDLLAIVTESVQAYKKCQTRIDAVEQALAQALEGSSVGTAASRLSPEERPVAPPAQTNRPPASRQLGHNFEQVDKDIPF